MTDRLGDLLMALLWTAARMVGHRFVLRQY